MTLLVPKKRWTARHPILFGLIIFVVVMATLGRVSIERYRCESICVARNEPPFKYIAKSRKTNGSRCFCNNQADPNVWQEIKEEFRIFW